MIVVDTSVWIDLFAGRTELPHVRAAIGLVEADEAIALTDVVLTEVLQGLRHDRDVRRVDEALSAHEILRLEGLDDFRSAAELYRRCRRAGATIRHPNDCLIAAVCIREDVALLHADRDFEHLARLCGLQILSHE